MKIKIQARDKSKCFKCGSFDSAWCNQDGTENLHFD